MAERLSLPDGTLYHGYAQHIQRYEFALKYCTSKRVLDAGCGTGYGSHYLAVQGAFEVVAVDISEDALEEARHCYQRGNLRFRRGNVEELSTIPDLGGPFDVVVNLENIEHLQAPGRFLNEAHKLLKDDGILVASSPNGDLTVRNCDGSPFNQYHVKEYNANEFAVFLGATFANVKLFGQWMTPERKARMATEHRVFEQLCEFYYSPTSRLFRVLKRMVGKKYAPPPAFYEAGTSYSGEFTIEALQDKPFPWPPDVLLAVCSMNEH